MKQNNKIIMLGVLVIVVVFTWIPKGAKPATASADTEVDAPEQEIPIMIAAPGKRTEFVDWGRDPFSFSQGEKTGDISTLSLRAIMWDAENPSAYINDLIVIVGDRIADKTVKQIEKTRVTLTDQKTDYVLELKKEW
ncbi:MAG: hypothetical protein H8E17_09625 [Deltaproteobacteria bacterium]|nr:hypothetical protein [Deltaproteobacteria bacterium]